jgi:hypothetical protein
LHACTVTQTVPLQPFAAAAASNPRMSRRLRWLQLQLTDGTGVLDGRSNRTQAGTRGDRQ